MWGIFLCEGRTAQIVFDFVFENDKWLGNAQTNERINKVRACDEKLFFSLNIGNGLVSYCEWNNPNACHKQATGSTRWRFIQLYKLNYSVFLFRETK